MAIKMFTESTYTYGFSTKHMINPNQCVVNSFTETMPNDHRKFTSGKNAKAIKRNASDSATPERYLSEDESSSRFRLDGDDEFFDSEGRSLVSRCIITCPVSVSKKGTCKAWT